MSGTQQNPWEAFEAEHGRCEHISGTISRIVHDMGILVRLDGGIDGLVHLNDLDWILPGEMVIDRYSVGDEVETVIISIDPGRERISLGIKQLTDDPRDDQHIDPPAPAPVRPKNPKPPKPLSESVDVGKHGL